MCGRLYFNKDPNQLLKITCSVMELQHTNLDLDDKRSCPQSIASSVLCWDPVTLLKMDGDLLKYSSSKRGKQVLVRTEWAATRSLTETQCSRVVHALELESHQGTPRKEKRADVFTPPSLFTDKTVALKSQINYARLFYPEFPN